MMDMLKKRKLDENGIGVLNDGLIGPASTRLTPQDARKILERFSTDQLLDILQEAVVRHQDVLEYVRSIADSDISQRKLFIRGLAAETTSEGLRSLFSNYGDLEEAIVILDKVTAKSKGYGFVTFKHVDGALLALKDPSKKIDGRVTVTQLAAAGNQGAISHVSDISTRKIYVANVPFDMPADRLLNMFLAYGDIEEGPLGFDKVTGKSRGFALFVYKTSEGAQAALAEPTKVIDGKNLHCKLAIDGKKGKPSGQDGGAGPGHAHADGMRMVPPPGPYGAAGGHGGPGGVGGYGGYSGGPPPHHMNSTPSSIGVAAAGAGGYGGAYSGHYSGYGSAGSGGYGGLGAGSMGAASGGYGGPGAGSMGGGGYGGPGTGNGPYRTPQSSMSGGGYPESGHYGHSSASAAYPGQHQPVGSSPVPRVPLGGMYPNVPPNY